MTTSVASRRARVASRRVPTQVQVNGIMMFIFGMQMMVQAQYNVFGDQMMPFIYMMTINNCQVINAIIMKLAIYMKLWRVKHENTAWHTALQESDEFEVPGWEDLKGAISAF